jgi:hypothetical protein
MRLVWTQRGKTDLPGDVAQSRQFEPERGDGEIGCARSRGVEVPRPGEILLSAAEHAFEQAGQAPGEGQQQGQAQQVEDRVEQRELRRDPCVPGDPGDAGQQPRQHRQRHAGGNEVEGDMPQRHALGAGGRLHRRQHRRRGGAEVGADDRRG